MIIELKPFKAGQASNPLLGVDPIEMDKFPPLEGYLNLNEVEDLYIIVALFPPCSQDAGKPFVVGLDFRESSACYEQYFTKYPEAVAFAKTLADNGLPEFNLRNLRSKGVERRAAIYDRIKTAMEPLVSKGLLKLVN